MFLILLAPPKLQADPVPQSGPEPQAAPPAPPIQVRKPQAPPPPGPQPGFVYSIGQPTDEEQLYLEYINRSRANPSAEGARLAATTDPQVLAAYAFFGVDLSLMQSEFNTNPPVPPLAMNVQLMTAARWHSGNMFTNQYQGHNQTNGAIVMDPGNRLSTNGYNWVTWGENVYSYAESVFYGHAGLNVDWGPGTGGMQTPPGHRDNIHNATFREVGIGVFDGVNGTVGPQLVTQDFATKSGAVPLITGVVYYDFNANNFYDLGEGIGGVTVVVSGTSNTTVTADSGGYTVPVYTNGNYTLAFSAPGLATTQRVAVISTLKNVKIDIAPLYSPPVISGPNPAALNQSNSYTFTPVGAATAYQWQQTQLSPYNAIEGAENAFTNVTVTSSAGYSVLTNDIKASGSFSFHLAHPDPPTSQFIVLNPLLRPRTNSQLAFAKRLGFATTDQVARAQISTNGGAVWQDLWSQAGTGGSGDSAFTRITNSLTAYAGLSVQIRFVYEFVSGGYFNQTSGGVGLYLDDIGISNADQLLNPVTNNVLSGTSFAFYPTNAADYLLFARAQINSRTLNWGPALRVTAALAPPGIQLTNKPVLAGTQIQIDFNVTNYRSGMTFQLWKSSDLLAWSLDGSASFSILIANSRFRATASTAGASKMFYKVKAAY
ncbi:MAG: hypothetical protein QOJ40_1868 [Verrucomicrobiota bacterium]